MIHKACMPVYKIFLADGRTGGSLEVVQEVLADLKTSQELRMLFRSLLDDCQSLTFNIMIQVSQFASNSQLCQFSLRELFQKRMVIFNEICH